MKLFKLAIATVSLSALLLTSGCGKKSAVKFMEDVADQVCACKDTKCVEEVMKKSAEEGKKMSEDKDMKPSEDDMKKLAELQDKMKKCTEKMAAPAPK